MQKRPGQDHHRYQYLLRRLGDDPLEETIDPAQLALDFTTPPPPPATERPTSVRELAFRDRRAPTGGPPRRGGDRRRTGSR